MANADEKAPKPIMRPDDLATERTDMAAGVFLITCIISKLL